MAEVAQTVGVSERYFQQIFKESTGLTPNKFLTKKRLEAAVVKLLTTDLSIVEIALESGFSSTNYFEAVFKKEYHCTPTQYRMVHK